MVSSVDNIGTIADVNLSLVHFSFSSSCLTSDILLIHQRLLGMLMLMEADSVI
jgi:hypothetical protein